MQSESKGLLKIEVSYVDAKEETHKVTATDDSSFEVEQEASQVTVKLHLTDIGVTKKGRHILTLQLIGCFDLKRK